MKYERRYQYIKHICEGWQWDGRYFHKDGQRLYIAENGEIQEK